jgi:hypothetical protein
MNSDAGKQRAAAAPSAREAPAITPDASALSHGDREMRKRLGGDVETLASLDRRTTSRGERRSAEWIAQELRELGAQAVAVSTFRTQSSWVPAHLGHVAAGIAAGVVPGHAARLLAAGVALSYELDVSGRCQWLRTRAARTRWCIGVGIAAPGR